MQLIKKLFLLCMLVFLPLACGAGNQSVGDGDPEYSGQDVYYSLNGNIVSREEAVSNYYASIGEEVPDDVADIEIGSASEALYADDGYGAENVTQTQCLLADTWGPKHECDFPLNKLYGLNIPRSGNQHGCDAMEVTGIQSGVTIGGQDITSVGAGWQTGAADPGDALALWVVSCTAPDSGVSSGAAAVTIIDATPPPLGAFSCSAAGSGKKACKYQGGNIHLYTSRFEPDPAFIALSTSNKQRYIKDITRHEYGHTAGLGHFPCNGDAGDLMCSGRSPAVEGLHDYSLSAAQKSLLHRYNVNGTTPTP